MNGRGVRQGWTGTVARDLYLFFSNRQGFYHQLAIYRQECADKSKNNSIEIIYFMAIRINNDSVDINLTCTTNIQWVLFIFLILMIRYPVAFVVRLLKKKEQKKTSSILNDNKYLKNKTLSLN